MENNMTHTYRVCNIDYETFSAIESYTYIIASICSLIGNLLVILIVYRNKNLRTSTNYFIVSMSVSDILYPLFILLTNKFLEHSSRPRLSELVGNLLCKLLPFLVGISFGVSMLTLVAIAVYRFSAVMFPLRARVQNNRKRILVLVLTWVIPIVVKSPLLVYFEFKEQNQNCFLEMKSKERRIWSISNVSLLHFLPLLIMLIVYPITVIKLKQHRVPGNVVNHHAIIRRRRQNCRLTVMFLVITVAFLLCWGPFMIFWMLWDMKVIVDNCVFYLFYLTSLITPVFFHAINPVIYFIFLSSFRQGFKNIFRFSCCIRTRPQAPADNFELNNIPQGLHNN